MCPKKRRVTDKDSVGSRMGFRVFQRFYELTTNSKKVKTFDDFIDSKYYIAFVKFGRHLVELDPINCNDFVDFVIKNGVKLNDWSKDYVYETYLEDYMRREPPDRALERTIIFLNKWGTDNDCAYSDFFRLATPSEAAYFIKTGKVSPWVLYLSASADTMWDKFNDEQYAMIETIINPGVWKARIMKNAEDKEFIAGALEAAGL